MMSKSKDKRIIAFVLVLAAVFALSFFAMFREDYHSTDMTTLFSATVTRTERSGLDELEYIHIYVAEYPYPLHLSSEILKNIDKDVMILLQSGQKIHYRVDNSYLDLMEKSESLPFLPIVALSLDEKEIFSVEDYNSFFRVSMQSMRIESGLLSLVFLGAALIVIFRKTKPVKFNDNQRKE